MMRQVYNSIVLLPGLILAMMLCGCSSEEDFPVNPPSGDKDSLTLTLRVSPPEDASSLNGLTRDVSVSQSEIPDANANEGEMMKSWVVVAIRTDAGNNAKVAAVYHYQIPSGTREVDRVPIDALKGGTYTFYAFANLTNEQLKSIGVMTDADTYIAVGSDAPDFASKTLLIKGNSMPGDGSTTTTADYITGNGDIPMSSEPTTHTIAESGRQDYVIRLVRMVAKIRVEVTNNEDVDLGVRTIQLSNLTANNQNDAGVTTPITPNLYLLPGEKDASDNNRRKLHLASTTPKIEEAYYTIPEADRVVKAHTTQAYEFYVNESQISNPDGFRLTLHNYDNSGNYSVTRDYTYNDFTRIARNEIHVLPITLTRYRPSFTVEAFTAIGVTPQVTTRSDYVEINVGTYGDFHLTPFVQDWVTGEYKAITGTDATLHTAPYIELSDRYSDGNHRDDFTGDFWSGTAPQNTSTFTWNTNAITHKFEFSVGNYGGQATYVFRAGVKGTDDKTSIIERYFRIVNNKINFDDPNWSKRWHGGLR